MVNTSVWSHQKQGPIDDMYDLKTCKFPYGLLSLTAGKTLPGILDETGVKPKEESTMVILIRHILRVEKQNQVSKIVQPRLCLLGTA